MIFIVLLLFSSICFEGNPQLLRYPRNLQKLQGDISNVEPYEIQSVKKTIVGEKQTKLKPQESANTRNSENTAQISDQNPSQRIKYTRTKNHTIAEPTIHIDTENAIINYEKNDTIATQRHVVEIESMIIKHSSDKTNLLDYLLSDEDHSDNDIDENMKNTRRLLTDDNQNLTIPRHDLEIPHDGENSDDNKEPLLANDDKSSSPTNDDKISNDDKSSSPTNDDKIANDDKSSSPTNDDKIANDDKSSSPTNDGKIANDDKSSSPTNDDKIANDDKSSSSTLSNLNKKSEDEECTDTDDVKTAEETDSEDINENFRKNMPTVGSGIKELVKSRMMLFNHPRVCYACNSLSDLSCWSPSRSTSVKYCRQGHKYCLKKVYELRGQPQIIRDCGESCHASSTVATGEAYASCSVCHTDLCNSASGLVILNIVCTIIVVINIIVGFSKPI